MSGRIRLPQARKDLSRDRLLAEQAASLPMQPRLAAPWEPSVRVYLLDRMAQPPQRARPMARPFPIRLLKTEYHLLVLLRVQDHRPV